MTTWGVLVLASSFALGLGRLETSKAVRAAAWTTVVVIVLVSAKNGAL